ncbi:ABC transporter ATP-binding protein [Pseudobacteroides cellulosolvens]|uniref:Xenobiotic-transporting ATPase n=1 Tax=Pseudobacteroides cellulosolvens ATCC 35603 = DSM 2933 TaxID=398512 RepID=A0A0L6JSY9_9FIRM|nr:ABC transporter ATP-binding protein [Pseudobacteroides cellulosolvens]KNY28933.1 Xenobiotic-transporting ATPase [Pseudobacteroides cellulosolvens ATCC 35603 = DSM 2933]
MENKFLKQYYSIFIKPHLWKQIKSLAYLLIFTAAAVISPLIIKYIIDIGIGEKRLDLLYYLLLALFLDGIVMIIFYYLNTMECLKIGQSVVLNLKKLAFNNISNYNSKFFSKYKSSEIMYILGNEVESAKEIGVTMFSQLLINVSKVIGFLVILFNLSYQITISYTILIVAFTFLQKRFGKVVKDRFRKLNAENGELYSIIQEYVSKAQAIITFNVADFFLKRYESKQQQYFKKEYDYRLTNVFNQLIVVIVSVIGYMIVFGLGGVYVAKNIITIGSLFSINIYVQRLYESITGASNCYIEFQKMKVNMQRIFSIIDDENRVAYGDVKKDICGNIQLKEFGLSFDDLTLFKDYNLSIKQGDKVAFLGDNGSGKTSLINTLLRTVPYSGGNILIDGEKIENYNSEAFRSSVVGVSQKTFIFSGTIKENIIFSNTDVNEDQIYEVLKKVLLYEDVLKMKDGLNTVIGEKGIALSGGQAQKIALARLFFINPSVIILDEPTSALDAKAEEIVCDNIFNHFKKNTIIFITHRKYVLKYATKIVNLTPDLAFEECI